MNTSITITPYGYPRPAIADMKRVFLAIGYQSPYDPITITDLANAFASKMMHVPIDFKLMKFSPDQEKFKRMLEALNPTVITGTTPLKKAAAFYSMMRNMGMLEDEPEPGEEDNLIEQPNPELGDDPNSDSSDNSQDPEELEGEIADFSLNLDDDPNAIIGIRIIGIHAIFKLDSESEPKKNEKPANPEMIVHHINTTIMKIRDFVGTVGAQYCKVDGLIPEAIELTPDVKEIVNRISLLKNRPRIAAKHFPDDEQLRRIKDVRELPKLHSKMAVVHPMFEYNLMQRNLNVKERIPQGSQDVVVLIDSSASMGQMYKTIWVRSLLLHMYDEVIAGNSNLIIVTYEVYPFFKQAIKVTDARDVAKHLDWFPQFNLSVTNIENTVRLVIKAINAGKIGKHEVGKIHPHIIVMQDGDDSVLGDYTPEIPIHGFTLGQTNKSVKDMCERSGGSYELFYDGKRKT